MKIESYRMTYEVSFTSIKNMIDEMRDLKNTFAVVDRNILDAYENIKDLFDDNIFILDATENNKTLETSIKIIEKIVLLESRKETNIIAIGGGITQDVTCFAASVLYRGVNWYFVPTTLLAQTDSCIGSKSSINMIPYKNLLGTFYPPKKIFVCTEFLKTLSCREYKSGLGEIAKCALLNGTSEFDEFSNNIDNVLSRDYERLMYEIKRTLNYKKGLIEEDEFDSGIRNILNYGHTFGHAIESASKYKIPHGQAVSIGILVANRVSMRREYISDDFDLFVSNIIIKIIDMDLISKEFLEPSEVIPHMKKDKKYQGNHNCILLDRNGADKYSVSEDEIDLALKDVWGVLSDNSKSL